MAKKDTLKDSALQPQEDTNQDLLEFTTEELESRGVLLTRLQKMRDARNQMYPAFGNTTYQDFYEENRKKAHTILPGKKNEGDVIVSVGTLENKIEAVLSSINNLNLSPEVKAFDKDNNRDIITGIALEDTIAYTEELDNDEEKKLMRQKELLIQGTVFVEEKWKVTYKKERKLNREFDGKLADLQITVNLIKDSEGPSRRVVPGPCVYLGDITAFFMKDQPDIAVVEIFNYSQMQAMFGTWDRWQYVSKKLQSFNTETPNTGSTSQDTIIKWSLNNIGMDEVEMIMYQNRQQDEFQILLNGIPMLPVGFPLSAISPAGNYTIEKQVLKFIDNFAYGRGFIQSAERSADLLDEMYRLAILKTRKSFTPPYINTSKRVISPRVLNPGVITQGQGITADSLMPIGTEGQGVTPSEFSMLKELTDRIDKQTVSQQFAGQQGKSGTTATEVLELQRQAKVTLGLIVFCCSMLEKKVAYLRLYNLLQNWYKPIDMIKVDGQVEIPKYRKVVSQKSIEGAGNGERQIIGSEYVPSPEEVRYMELAEEKEKGFPIRMIFMNPVEMKKNIKNWYIVITPKEKDTSSTNKLMFREEIQDMVALAQFGITPSKDGLEDEYARVWGKDKSKIFAQGPTPEQIAAMQGAQGQGLDQNMNSDRPNIKGVATKPQA